ncbi:MAG: hypothetical protein CBB71_22250 [Rhodopirellula sp. TMED11]|nr:MAG: hypothetical protein CBB71_22250 [Rhodopirellula sp. TMED11]
MPLRERVGVEVVARTLMRGLLRKPIAMPGAMIHCPNRWRPSCWLLLSLRIQLVDLSNPKRSPRVAPSSASAESAALAHTMDSEGILPGESLQLVVALIHDKSNRMQIA